MAFINEYSKPAGGGRDVAVGSGAVKEFLLLILLGGFHFVLQSLRCVARAFVMTKPSCCNVYSRCVGAVYEKSYGPLGFVVFQFATACPTMSIGAG